MSRTLARLGLALLLAGAAGADSAAEPPRRPPGDRAAAGRAERLLSRSSCPPIRSSTWARRPPARTRSASTGGSATATTSTAAGSRSPPAPGPRSGRCSSRPGRSRSDEYFGREEIYRNAVSGTVPVPGDRRPGAHPVPAGDLPGLCGRRALLSADHQDPRVALPAAGRRDLGRGAELAADASSSALSDQQGYTSAALSGQPAGDARRLLRRRPAAGLHRLRLPDDSHPLRHHRRPGPQGHHRARLRAVADLRAGHGSHLHDRRHRVRGVGGQAPAAAFEQPWIVAIFAALFVAMALSMLGLFTVQMPAALQTRIANLSNRQTAGSTRRRRRHGRALGAHRHDLRGSGAGGGPGRDRPDGSGGSGRRRAVRHEHRHGHAAADRRRLGGQAAAEGRSLDGHDQAALRRDDAGRGRLDARPRAPGARHFGAVGSAGGRRGRGTVRRHAECPGGSLDAPRRRPGRGVYGLALITGAALGGTDPLAPIPAWAGTRQSLPFRPCARSPTSTVRWRRPRARGRPVMVDFYADWCTSCKEMEATTFLDPAVQQTLAGTVLLRADVTANDADDRALLQRFGIYGPPTIAFYGRDGQERSRYRVVGYMKGAEFARCRARRLRLAASLLYGDACLADPGPPGCRGHHRRRTWRVPRPRALDEARKPTPAALARRSSRRHRIDPAARIPLPSATARR